MCVTYAHKQPHTHALSLVLCLQAVTARAACSQAMQGKAQAEKGQETLRDADGVRNLDNFFSAATAVVAEAAVAVAADAA